MEVLRSVVPVEYPAKGLGTKSLRSRRWLPHGTMLIDVLGLCEFAAIIVAAFVAKILYIEFGLNDGLQSNRSYLLAGAVGGVLTVFMLRSQKLYERKAILEWDNVLGSLLRATTVSFLLLLAVAYLLKISTDFSRGWFIVWYALALLAVTSLRMMASHAFTWLAKTGRITRRMAVVVESDISAGLRLALELRKEPGVELLGVYAASDVPNGPVARANSELASFLKTQVVDEIVVLPGDGESRRLERLIGRLSAYPIDVWIHPQDLTIPIIGTEQVGAANLLHVQPKPIRKWGYIGKLVFDYAVGGLLLAFAAPFLALIALAIRLEGPGPIFFRQKRHGLNYRVIDVYKFRTMNVAENGPVVTQAQANDPRVTRVGRFLRKTSLDELPQLINVLRGEMSLVGPRPHAIAHNEFYGEQVERYANRHRVKPGITGLAQVSGFRGPTEDPEKMRQRVRKDLEYIANWSMWMDFKILALTAMRGFVHRNAI